MQERKKKSSISTMARRAAKLSEIDEQRALLDSLMGVNRNQDRAQDMISDYCDERVCKYFLHGICPSDLFLNTKSDVGACKLIHSDEMRSAFQRDVRSETNKASIGMFDHLIYPRLSNLVTEMDRRIVRERAKLEEVVITNDKLIDPELTPEVLALTAEVERHSDNIEALVEADDVDSARKIFFIIDALEAEKKELVRRSGLQRFASNATGTQKLKICNMCGSALSLADNDLRLGDHFQGKLHEGYKLIRQIIVTIKERGGDRGADRNERGYGGDRERDRVSDRGADRGSGYSRDSSYRSGTYNSSRDNYRGDSRDRSDVGRYGGYRRDRSRSRDRDRDRDRGRGRGW